MKRILILILCMVPLTIFAQKQTDANLLGHVINSKTGEHIAYMSVFLQGTTIGTVTDESGHFHIANCPEGTHTVVVRGVGYKQTEREVTFVRNKTVELDFRLEPDAITLGQVVVTATQHATSRMETPAVVSVVGSEDLSAANAVNLAEGLRFQTGICVENTCQNCGANEVRINGLGGAYSQVLIDSRPVNNALASLYLLEQLPSVMIEQIEVMRGGGSALYGSNAVGGVVNVITKEPIGNMASVESVARLVGGKSADWSQSFNASVVSDNRKAGLIIYGNNRHRDPYDDNGDSISEVGLMKIRMVGFRGYLRTSDHSKLNIEYHNISDYRRGGDRFDLPVNQAHVAEGGEHDIHCGSAKWDWFAADGLSHASLFASAQYVNRESYNGEREDDEPFGNSYGFTTGLTTNEGFQYSRHFRQLFFMPAELTAGIEHTYDHLTDRLLTDTDTLDQSTTMLSAYLQNEWKDKHWNLLVGLRADRHSMLDNIIVSPRLNLRYAPSHHLVLRTGYSSGFRAPQVYDEDLHVGAVNGELYKITNAADLQQERSHSLTASADLCFHLGKVDGDLLVEGFYTRINDAFVNELLFDDTVSGYRHYERRNSDGAQVEGISMGLDLVFSEQCRMQLGATWQQSRYTGQGVEWDEGRYENRMERIPDVYGHLTASYTPFKHLDLIAMGTFSGPMLVYHSVTHNDATKHSHSTTVEQVITPSFFDLTLKASYSIAMGSHSTLEIGCGVQNVFNSYQRDFDRGPDRDASYIYGPTLPRTAFLNLRLSI